MPDRDPEPPDHGFSQRAQALVRRTLALRRRPDFARDQLQDACKRAKTSRGPWPVNGDSLGCEAIFLLTPRRAFSSQGNAPFWSGEAEPFGRMSRTRTG